MSEPKRTGVRPSSRGAAAAPKPGVPAAAVIVAIVVALLAALIIKSMGDDDTTTIIGTSPVTDPGGTIDGTAANGAPVTVTPSTLQQATVTKADFLLVVANNAKVDGAAGKMTDALKARGFRTIKASNVIAGTAARADTRVYFQSGGQAAAALVAAEMSLATAPEAVPAAGFPVDPVNFGVSPNNATVIVLLGTDLANKALPAAALGSAATIPVATVPSTSVAG